MRYNQLIIFCLFILLYGVEFASCGAECSTTGVWGEWGSWTKCPNTGDPTWDFITRQRECMPTPTGCTQMKPFSCPGKYSEVEFCNTTPAPVVTMTPETSPSQEEQTTSRIVNATTSSPIVNATTSSPIVQETSPSGSEGDTSPVGGSSEGNVATSPANSPTSAVNSGSSPDSGNDETSPAEADATSPSAQETSPAAEGSSAQASGSSVPASGGNTSPAPSVTDGNVDTSPAQSGSSPEPEGSSPSGQGSSPQDSGSSQAAQGTSPSESGETSPAGNSESSPSEGGETSPSGNGGESSPVPGSGSSPSGNEETSPGGNSGSPSGDGESSPMPNSGSSPSGASESSPSGSEDSGSPTGDSSVSGSGSETSPMPDGNSGAPSGSSTVPGNSEPSATGQPGATQPTGGSSEPDSGGETSPMPNSESSPSGGGETSPSGNGEESSPMPGSGSSPSGNGETSPDGNSGSSPSGASESSPSGSEDSGAPTGDSSVSDSGSETSPMPDGNSGAPSGSSAVPGNSEPSATGQSEASQDAGGSSEPASEGETSPMTSENSGSSAGPENSEPATTGQSEASQATEGGSSVSASGETSSMPVSESSYASEGPRGSVEPGDPPATTTTMKPGSGTTAPKTTKTNQGSETTHLTTTTTVRTQDPQSSVTTSFVAIVCDNCNDLNVYLYKGQPYQDGASVLNRYTSSGCKFVQFFCRPIDWSDSSTVRTVFNKNPNATAPLNANIQCMNGKWYDEENHTEISSLSCIYDQNEDSVTTSATTLSPTSTAKGPLSESAPIVDHNIPCQNCSQLVVNPKVDQAGSAILNFELGDCLTVDVFCQPVGNFTTVDLLFDGVSIGLSGSTVNRTFTCNNATQWVDVTTGQIVMNIACAMVNSSTSTVAPPSTTPATLPIVTEDPLSACDRCPNVIAQPLNETNYYNGMLVLDHYNQTSKCRVVDMTCQGTRPSEYTALIINSYYFISVGTGVQELTVTCSSSGTWLWDGLDITTASCILTDSSTQPIPNNMSTLPPTAAPATMPTTTAVTLAPGQTTPDPAIVACNSCSRLPVISNGVNNFENGFTILQNGNNGQCMEVAVTCQGEASTESVAIVSGVNILESSQGSVQMNLTCNEFHVWTSPDGIVIDSISCSVARERTTALLPTTPTTVPSTSTLPPTTTTTATTTTTVPLTTTTTAMPTTASLCSSCPNMEALSIPSPNDVDTNGQLLLDHYVQSLINCRTVVIKCSGPDTYHNATILYNGVMEPSMMITSPGQISTSLVCDSTGQWSRLGKSITGVACLVQALPNGATLPPVVPTTSAPEITVPVPTETAACASCSRSLVTSVPSGYQGAFLTMDSSFNPCLSVQLSCSAPDHVSAVSILSSTGLLLSTSNGMTNLTISCSDSAQWVTQFGTAITGISCGIVAPTTIPATTTTTLPTLPTTLTTLLTQATTTTRQPSQGAGGCESSYWAEWQEWSSCTDDCGSCGTHQRFRACNKAMPDCLCSGTAYEKVPCNLNVCKYPRTPSCCTPYTPQSGSNGVFQCLSPPTD